MSKYVFLQTMHSIYLHLHGHSNEFSHKYWDRYHCVTKLTGYYGIMILQCIKFHCLLFHWHITKNFPVTVGKCTIFYAGYMICISWLNIQYKNYMCHLLLISKNKMTPQIFIQFWLHILHEKKTYNSINESIKHI